MAYFLRGKQYILWDNIPRGMQISCPHIERSCTVGVLRRPRARRQRIAQASAATIHIFTGNNIGAKGDLASRSLNIRLDVDRADPENREFKHSDPVGWTSATAARSCRRSTPSCWAIRNSRRRTTPRARPASRCGGGWSGRRSRTPRRQPATSWIS